MTITYNIAQRYGTTETPKLNAWHSTSDEFRELVDEGLIGENSRMSNFYNTVDSGGAHTFQWSQSDNNRWHAFNQESEYGQQAAGYLEQMVDERRSLANDYIGQYHSLSLTLGKAFADRYPAPSLDQMLDNVAAGREPTENSNGTTMRDAARLNQFWQQNEAELTELQASYKALNDFPGELSEWLDENDVDRPVEVDQVVEKYRYAGLNGVAETSAELVDTSSARLDGKESNGIVPPGPHAMHQKMDEFGVIGAPDPDRVRYILDFAQTHGADMGLTALESQQLMDLDKREAWGSYQTLYQPMADEFNSQFQSPLEPRFTLQDIIDNLREGLSAAQLDNGTMHPLASQIEQTFSSREMKEQLGDYLQSDWLRDGTTTEGGASKIDQLDIEDTVAELLALINQGRAVMNNGIVDTLLMGNDSEAAENQSG